MTRAFFLDFLRFLGAGLAAESNCGDSLLLFCKLVEELSLLGLRDWVVDGELLFEGERDKTGCQVAESFVSLL